jgi:hypothetical protein
MGYVGNEPSVNFTSFAKQDITGDGGASYTLTHAVANANEIEVFVNNVRQEPTEAYTVSGTALTMTGNVASTDDFYVIYLGKALQTTTPPDGSVTSAKLDTNIAIDGDLTVDTSTLKVDSTNNRVGINVSSPTVALDVASADNNQIQIANTGGGAAFIGIDSSNVLNIGRAGPVDIAFQTNSAERMRIDSSGNVGIAISSINSNYKFSVDGNIVGAFIETSNTNSGVEALIVNRPNDGTLVSFTNNAVEKGKITVNSSSTTYATSSDYRLKENVTADWDATTRLKQLNPVRFNFIADADTTVDGFLAHEVQSVVPEAITGTHNEVDDDGNPVYQGIDQSKLVPLLVKTIQELEARITALENS